MISVLSSLRIITCLFVCLVGSAYATNTNITWGFSPTPTVVNIAVGDTVTWNGNMVSHPLRSTDVNFSSLGPTISSGGTSYVRTFATPGSYYFMCVAHGASMPTTVNVSCPQPPPTLAVLDIDGDGKVNAATDGLLVARYLNGLRGDTLVLNVVSPCASRNTMAIEAYLAAKIVP
jgi:hypothetical protein